MTATRIAEEAREIAQRMGKLYIQLDAPLDGAADAVRDLALLVVRLADMVAETRVT